MTNRIVRHNGIPEHDQTCNCLDCRTAWEEYWEPRHNVERLALRDIELRQAKPATDEEWAAFFDAEFPRVKEGVTS